MLVCTPYITLKNGQKLYAHEKGLEVFCFEVSEEQHKKYLEKKDKRNSKSSNITKDKVKDKDTE
ncbi:MAG: hypothetical protein E7L01_02175 [Paenibacillus macerans]|uniref:Uncharacterized protein n=1 Tax=Paenibacillus macerans TaxID=44252 RepID=A0A090ZNP6_PAEMA|nr:hypothetical protein [Paenibacillus macerans]KFN12227.1 hypothetical protein DJ90_2038 [Paenibacillus macerans]MCY7558467.1 hypothetical protein [Paenibacillus macerans]MDU7472157.1 hypothetical protein [Paenibacillus macerans]MEC0150232.1 hypothetical protein [Paenibacillus macerans]MEC0331972.1 hypothetical protein [Paenibacillus macerans]